MHAPESPHSNSVQTPGAPCCSGPRAPLGPPHPVLCVPLGCPTTQLPAVPQDTQPWLPTAPHPAPGDLYPCDPLGQQSRGLGCGQLLQHRAPSFWQAWAIYKGKYHEGTDKADPSTWKTRLRCALNKSTDFQEVPERSQLDISEPYKVYQIVSEGTRDAGTFLPSLLLHDTWGWCLH